MTISPSLWFDTQAEEAVEFYISIFPNSRILQVSRYGEGAPMPAGTALGISFVLDGLEVQAINGGPVFPFTEAISLAVTVETQQEVDRLWDALTADGGEESMCGWLKDKYGLSWQIIPSILPALLSDPDPARSGRAMQAMLGMRKLDIAVLQAAAAGQ